MRIMKWSVTLLFAALILGSAVPASAQTVTMDAATLERIKFQLEQALDGLSKSNATKAWNRVTWALGLLPDAQSAPVGWFKIVAPFVWSASSGPMPIRIGAMIDDGAPQQLFQGTVVLGMMAYGQIATLYDNNMVALSGTQTTNFFNGSWQGYVTLRYADPIDLGLKATDPVSGVGGTSTPIRWTP